MKVFSNGADRVLPVSSDGEADMRAFQDERNFRGGRFIKPPEKQARGFSEDRTSFTDRSGRTLPVRQGDQQENEQVEMCGFEMQFANELKCIDFSNRQEVIYRTITILKNANITPMQANNNCVQLAIRAAQGSDEVIDRAMRYASVVETFGSFEKALVAAMA